MNFASTSTTNNNKKTAKTSTLSTSINMPNTISSTQIFDRAHITGRDHKNICHITYFNFYKKNYNTNTCNISCKSSDTSNN